MILIIHTKNTMDGAAALAFLNNSRIALSDSPTHLLNNSGPFTAIKFNPASVANAFAIIVLLQPGGPYSSIPFGGLHNNLNKVY